MDWNSNSHSKYLLQYHLIFVCKYRKKLFTQMISDDVKQLSYEICKKHNVKIKTMEADKDHIHYMIETKPNCNVFNFVKTIKLYITFHIWKYHKTFYRNTFGKNIHFLRTDILCVP